MNSAVMNNRFSTQPFAYASVEDAKRALLVCMRRFNRANQAMGALKGISLGPTTERKTVVVKNADSQKLDNLDTIRAQIRLLRNLSGQLQTTFGASKDAKGLKTEVDALTAKIVQRFNSMQDEISENNKERINPSVKNATNALIRDLQADLKLDEDHIVAQYFIGNIAPPQTSEANLMAEVTYIRLMDLKGPDGFAHQNIIIALGFPHSYKGKTGTAIVDVNKKGDSSLHTYVSVSPEFKIPKKIRWDATVTKLNELKDIVKSLLEKDGIIGSNIKRSLPIPEDSVNFDHKNIESTKVVGDTIQVKVKDKRQLDATMDDLRHQLTSIVRAVNPRNRDLIRTKLQRDTGTILFIFSLPGKLKGRIISQDALTQIKRALNLDDAELLRIRTALEDHEQ